VAARATQRGKCWKRSLPANTDKEPVARKKFGIEVQQSTTRMSEFGGSITAIWVTSFILTGQISYQLNKTLSAGSRVATPP